MQPLPPLNPPSLPLPLCVWCPRPLQANPSQAEQAFRQFKARKEAAEKKARGSVAERYGDGGAQAPPEDLRLLAQTEAYVEYDAAGGCGL